MWSWSLVAQHSRSVAETCSKNLSILTIHGYFDPLYIPAVLPIWDPDGGFTPESREVSSTFPQKLVRVLLPSHFGIAANLVRSLSDRGKVPKESRASSLGVIEPA